MVILVAVGGFRCTMKFAAWGRDMFDEVTILRLHRLLSECHKLQGLAQFESFIRTRINTILPHRIAICGLGEVPSKRLIRLLNIGFSSAYIRRVAGPRVTFSGAPMQVWLRERRPLVLHVDRVTDPQLSSWCAAARAHNVPTTACHGMFDMTSTVFSYFEFGRLEEDMLSYYPPILNLVVPHLHAALARLLSMDATFMPAPMRLEGHGGNRERATAMRPQVQAPLRHDAGTAAITERERQVLQWVAAGKSNWEIGKILRISEFTVKNHVQNVLRKLSVSSRAQAVTKGIFGGLIDHA